MKPRYLLIISCSRRKRTDPDLLPAIDRYDGGNFRVLRKAKRNGYWPKNLDVLILSARYGLIEDSTEISNYEQSMTTQNANDLKTQVRDFLNVYLEGKEYKEIYIDLGRKYLRALEDCRDLLKNKPISIAEGRVGERLSKLKLWIIGLSKDFS
jgi:hypothetical protein